MIPKNVSILPYSFPMFSYSSSYICFLRYIFCNRSKLLLACELGHTHTGMGTEKYMLEKALQLLHTKNHEPCKTNSSVKNEIFVIYFEVLSSKYMFSPVENKKKIGIQ